MNTPELFYESYAEALRDDVKAAGGTKKIASMLWPAKSEETARNKLNDALNPDRRERLSEDEERLIMRKAREIRGFSAALYFICDDTSFERPKAKDVKDEISELQRQFIAAVRTQEASAERMSRLMDQINRQSMMKVA